MARPFDENPIGSRYRERYGEYRKRYSMQKVATTAGGSANTDGVDGRIWVPIPVTGNMFNPTIWDVAMYRHTITIVPGGWGGTPQYRIVVNDVKVYPFADEETIQSGVLIYLGSLSINLRVGDECRVQARSTSQWDTGLWVHSSVDIVQFKDSVGG